MIKRRRVVAAVATVGMAIFILGCADGGPSSPSTTTMPTQRPGVIATPELMSIAPNVGSTTGDTPIVITGSGFLPGATATFGGVPVAARFDSRYTDRIYLPAPAHTAGTVDVLVANTGGQSGRLAAGYTYVAPESFDFNGTWSGFPVDGSDLPIEFTIQNNQLLRASCDASVVTFSPPVPLTNGAFSFSRQGSTMTGKIVSASQSVGAILLTPCNAPHWEATRKP